MLTAQNQSENNIFDLLLFFSILMILSETLKWWSLISFQTLGIVKLCGNHKVLSLLTGGKKKKKRRIQLLRRTSFLSLIGKKFKKILKELKKKIKINVINGNWKKKNFLSNYLLLWNFARNHILLQEVFPCRSLVFYAFNHTHLLFSV